MASTTIQDRFRAGAEALPVPSESDFTSRLRSPAVASRVGLWLGIAFTVCFLTGLLSHWAQIPTPAVPFPSEPYWGYRVTQGLHVITGTAAVPLLLVKLWAVYPKLFAKVPFGNRRALVVEGLERVSILVLVAGAIFLLVSGLFNTTRYYPWSFSFRPTHYAAAWVTIGALVVHIAVKLPIIRDTLTSDVDDTSHDRPSATQQGVLSRRGLLRTTWAAVGVAVLATAGSTVPFLRQVSVLAVRTGDGPQGVPINRTAEAAQVTREDGDTSWTLGLVSADGVRTSWSRTDLEAMTQRTESLPIACVEGWSAGADWTGVRLRDLLDEAGIPRGTDLRMVSLQRRFAFGVTILPANFADDDQTLIALRLNGEELALDHGYPARLIAPNRPGVLQTKWLTTVEAL